MLSNSPKYIFIGVYLPPEDSVYADPAAFARLCELLLKCREKGLTPFLGGDFNSRLGELNNLPCRWTYLPNCDTTQNNYGKTYFVDMCTTCKICPINNIVYKRKEFKSDFTYIKHNKKSHIDFILTNKDGLNNVTNFNIISNDWHLSDHRPVTCELNLPRTTNANNIFLRALELNVERLEKNNISRLSSRYDYDVVGQYMHQHQTATERNVTTALHNNDPETAITLLDTLIHNAHNQQGCKQKSTQNTQKNTTLFDDCNNAFEQYCTTFDNPDLTQEEKDSSMNRYNSLRNKLTVEVLKDDHSRWVDVLNGNSSSELWERIDWNGKLNAPPSTNFPPPEIFAAHFEDLYKATDDKECENIMSLQSDVTIPLLDDPITQSEVEDALDDMKKGGYDFPLPVVHILRKLFLPVLVLLMNVMFYVKYPVQLAVSLLFTIPKSGNLSIATNFRGIQMMKSIACLYDRVINCRLLSWIRVSDEQTAYQKGKSILIHLFTMRLLIELAKSCNITLYIGFFDIAKAFDHVSRYLLLKKLVSLGVGRCMLKALQMMYYATYCVVNGKGMCSKVFRTFTGIRQGATSSTNLFTAFMDDLIAHLKSKCAPEQLIMDLHSLLHADDTVLLSTSRRAFVFKCKEMVNCFKEKKLNLNVSKSRYMIINGKTNDHKVKLDIGHGFLAYAKTYKYLGYYISDTGKLCDDFGLNVNSKRANLTIKYLNFCRSNFMAPLKVKLDVLNVCLKSSVLFGCEVWANSKLDKLECCYRKAIKNALSVRPSVNNEIAYIESGQFPLVCDVKSRQLKFWMTLQEDMMNKPDNYLSRLIDLAVEKKIPYVLYYTKLADTYRNSKTCKDTLKEQYFNTWTSRVENCSSDDNESKLGVYKQINPNLQCYTTEQPLPEFERIHITRFRTGSHNLKIETGRHSRIARENRLCTCKTGIQTLNHVIFTCPLTTRLPNTTNLHEFFTQTPHDIITYIQTFSKTLKIKIH